VAEAVKQGDEEDGFVAAQHPVGQPSPKKRHEINAEDKQVNDLRSLLGSLTEVFGEEQGQDAAHPIDTEPLTGLVADDVLDLRRE
jgi:hypothetical protein